MKIVDIEYTLLGSRRKLVKNLIRKVCLRRVKMLDRVFLDAKRRFMVKLRDNSHYDCKVETQIKNIKRQLFFRYQ